MMRQKQKPFFSTLTDADLDLSDLETVHNDKKPDLLKSESLPVEDAVLQHPDVPSEIVSAATPQAVPTEITTIAARRADEVPVSVSVEVMPEKPAVPAPDAGMPDSRPSNADLPEPVVEKAHLTAPPLSKTPFVSSVGPAEGSFRGASAFIETALFVPIQPGRFLMGSPEDEPGRSSDEIPHEVTLTREYAIQATPVTQGQWQAMMGNNPSRFRSGGPDCPVEGVSWNDCQEFIRKINRSGKFLYRLPTEAEWEFACRAGSSTAFCNGNIVKKFLWKSDPHLDQIGWYCGNSIKKTHPVGQKLPNAWGVYDMHGNVYEWCQDWYGMYPRMSHTDPHGVNIGLGCVVRGGAWSGETRHCRSAARSFRSPNERSDTVGFRLVQEP